MTKQKGGGGWRKRGWRCAYYMGVLQQDGTYHYVCSQARDKRPQYAHLCVTHAKMIKEMKQNQGTTLSTLDYSTEGNINQLMQIAGHYSMDFSHKHTSARSVKGEHIA